ncbi:nicotinamide mononucleotide transporter [Candidatus Nomurabacteria bacterium]|nr:nicotinamide mononucleotide transporter [Candidatus Kaiserbacteria bacterium]MCB9811115.1 nicotinamide mononucleotide transporter [Candidatus Nomurabacteria bacterium]MCB9814449.1 nicotinamide mononucleotide transporter [Candidatus Nomurabacteria bacterium]
MNTYDSWATRLLGDREVHKEHAIVVISMFIVTALYEYLASNYIPDFSINWYEFVGTWAGLSCVWLTRTQNVLCWPWGIVSSVAFGFFFKEIGLPGQQWLNWGYFLAIQLWAWPYWVFGGANRTELKVTKLGMKGRVLTLAVLALGTYVIYRLIGQFAPGSLYPMLDALVVAASITAQYLLGRKIIESWWLWLGPVNLLSIVLFFTAGAYIVMALYVAFFIHAIFALREWCAEKKRI